MHTSIFLSCLLIAQSQQLFRKGNDKESLQLFSKLIQDMTNYCKSSGVHFIVRNTTDKNTNGIQILIKNGTNWKMNRVYEYVGHEALVKDLDRYETMPSLVIIYSPIDDFVVSIIDKMTSEHRLLNHLSWLIRTPKDINAYRKLVIPPSFRLFTFEILKREGISMMKVGFLFTEHKQTFTMIRHRDIGGMTKNRKLHIKIPFKRCCYDLKGYGINVIHVKDDKPYTAVEKTGNNSWVLSGIVGDVFTIIFEKLGIRLNNVYPEPNNVFGGLDENNQPVGLFKHLHDKSADIALTGLIDTSVRRQISDLTIGFVRTSLTGMYREHRVDRNILSFFSNPFLEASWILIIPSTTALLLVAAISLKFLKNVPIIGTLLDLWGAVLGQGTYEETQMKSISKRCFYIAIFLLGMLLSFFYNSKLVANKAVVLKIVRFHSLGDVVPDKHYYPLVRKYSAWYNIFKQSTDEEFKEVWQRIASDIYKHTSNDMKSIEHKLEFNKGVFITSKMDLEYMKTKNKDYVVLDKDYMINSNVVALQKYSPLTRMINNLLLEMLENGVINKCMKRYKPKEKISNEEPKPQEIGFYEFSLLIIVHSISIVFVFFILSLEIVYHQSRRLY